MSSSNYDIDQLVSQEGRSQVTELNQLLDATVDKCMKVVAAGEKISSSFGKPSAGGGLKSTITEIEVLNRETEKLARANGDLASEIALAREATRQQNAENRLAAKEALAAEGSYNKMEAQLSRLTAKWKNYTDAEMQATSEGKRATAQIEILTNKLKEMDAKRGVFNRNVGDYKNQLKDLGVQIRKNIDEYNALSAAEKKADMGQQMKANIINMGATYRELAAGTSTATTGMLTFETAIAKVPTAADKAIKGVGGVWSIIRKAAYILPGLGIAGIMHGIFSMFNMALPFVSEFFEKLIDGNKEAKKAAEELAKAIGDETGKLETLTRGLNNHNLSKEEHLRLAKELKELYPTALKNYSLEEIAAGKAAGAILLIKNALVAVAMAKAAQADVDKKAAEIWANDTKKAELLAQLPAAQRNEASLQNAVKLGEGSVHQDMLINQANKAANKVADLKAEILDLMKANVQLGHEMDDISERIGKFGDKTAAAGLKLDGSDVTKGEKKPKKEKEVNRVEDLKKEYDQQKLIADNFHLENKTSELAYQAELLRIAAEYSKKRILIDDKLTDDEKASKIKFINSILNDTKKVNDEIEKDIKEAYKQAHKDVGDSVQESMRQRAIEDLQKINKIIGEITGKPVTINISLGKDKLTPEQQKKYIKEIKDGLMELSQALIQIAINSVNNKADAQIKAIDATEKAQLDSLDRMTMADKKREDERKRIEKEAEIRRKKVEHDRITDLRKYAKMQRALNIMMATGNTIAGVTRAFKDYAFPYNLIVAAAVGVAGAAQIAQAVAQPLPQYKKGRTGGKAEYARVSEEGQEARVDKQGNFSLLPEKEAVVFLNEGDSVIPALKTKELLKRASYAHLGQVAYVSTSTDQAALIGEISDLKSEVKYLTAVMKGKNMTVNLLGDSSHIAHVKNSIK